MTIMFGCGGRCRLMIFFTTHTHDICQPTDAINRGSSNDAGEEVWFGGNLNAFRGGDCATSLVGVEILFSIVVVVARKASDSHDDDVNDDWKEKESG